MNYKIFLSYLLILVFFLFLVLAYIKYNDVVSENENDRLRQQMVAVLDKEIMNLQSQIDELKKNSSTTIDEKAMSDFIQNNPQLIATILENFFNEKNLDEKNKSVGDNIASLLQDFDAGLIKTFIGKADAQLKIIEFFDYSCSFCGKMVAINNKIVEENQDLAMIFIEIPMLGPDSVEAAKISIAVSLLDQSKYIQFQSALFNSTLPKNRENLMQIATNIGINTVKLQKFVDDNLNQIEEKIKQNSILFNNMKLQGIPTYVIGSEILVGAVGIDKINEAIARAKNEIKK